MSGFLEGIITIVLAIVTLAVISVLVSKKAQTPQVLQSFFSGIGNSIGVAQSPVTGENVPINLSYPGSGGFGGNFGTSFGF